MWGRTWASIDSNEGIYDSVFSESGYSIAGGYFRGTMDFDPGPEEYYISVVDSAGFIMKLRPDGYW
jgi:hypothetical protein